jgi:hypothetical protein
VDLKYCDLPMNTNISAAVAAIENSLREASNSFMDACYSLVDSSERRDYDVLVEYYVERAFVELLVLLEHLGLKETYNQVNALYDEAKAQSFDESAMGPDEPYLVWNEKIRIYLGAVSTAYGLGEGSKSDVRDLKAIIRRAVYAICDTGIFPCVPGKEAHVHDRIEAILKCHYADLKRKPPLAKPIKHFEPDTGIPSIKTLIEYKFVATKADAKRVADEILADSSGYRSPPWKNFLFVIYETSRVMSEDDWTALLRECNLGPNYDAIVLSGDSSTTV